MDNDYWRNIHILQPDLDDDLLTWIIDIIAHKDAMCFHIEVLHLGFSFKTGNFAFTKFPGQLLL